MRIPIYFDNGTDFLPLDHYKSAEFAIGFTADEKHKTAGANKFIIKTTMEDEPFLGSNGRFVEESESPTEFYSWPYCCCDINYPDNEVVYYGFTGRRALYGRRKAEYGGHAETVTDYEMQHLILRTSELISSGYDVIYGYDTHQNVEDEAHARALITVKEPNIPWGLPEWELGDMVSLIDDVYMSGKFPSGYYVTRYITEKRLICNEETYKVQYTMTALPGEIKYGLPAGSSDYDCFARWNHSSGMWYASRLE